MSRVGRKVVICVDNSESSLSAFHSYLQNFHVEGTEILILHVSDHVRIPAIQDGGKMLDVVQVHVDEIRKCNKAIYEKYDTLCKEMKLNYKISIHDSPNTSTGAAIVELVAEMRADSIVVGCRGLGMLRRTILGSVSEYVVHHSDIPVVVCPNSKLN